MKINTSCRRAIVESLESRKLLSGIGHLGDANGDSRVDTQDFAIFAQHFNQVASGGPAIGDFDSNARVNALDFNILATNFGRVEMPLTVNELQATEGGSEMSDPTNWSQNRLPNQGDEAVIATGAIGSLGTRTIGKLTISNGQGEDFSGADADLSGVTVDDGAGGGDVVAVGTAGLALTSIAGNFVATGNTGAALIGSLHGNLTVNGGWTLTTTLSGSGKTITSNSGTLDLGGATIPGNYTLASVSGGTVSDFTQLRTSGQQAKYATVTGGVEQSRATGSTYTITVDASWGFTPNQVNIGGYAGNPIAITGSNPYTIVLPSDLDLGAGQVVTLSADGVTTLALDTITVVAPSSSSGLPVGDLFVPSKLNAGASVATQSGLCVE